MTRKRYIGVPGGGWAEISDRHEAPTSAAVWGELPDYESPIDGRIVSGRAQRREDLKRNGCRPFEGMAAERKEAQRQVGYEERARDASLERCAGQAFAQLHPRLKKALIYR